jgi:superfamily II DNA or RNA helicase
MVEVLSVALREATDVAVAVAFVHMSGLHLLLHELARLRERGHRVRVLTSTYLLSTEPQALLSLRERLGEGLRVQEGPQGFHAKCHLLVRGDERVAWVGSSNWTLPGLRDNLEWNARVTDPASLDAAWASFEALWGREDVRPIDDAWLALYTARWRAQKLAELVRPAPTGVAETYEPALQPTALQQRALAALDASRKNKKMRALVVAATGTGKTLLAAFDVEQAGAKTLLFVAHRKDIVLQAAKEFARVHGDVAMEVLVEGKKPAAATAEPRFVFVTIQALLSASGAPLLARTYDYVVADEFHHADAPGWQRALRRVAAGFLLGLTATPERADGRDVAALCDHNVVFEIRLPDAIREGFLLPFHYFGVRDDERVNHDSLRHADEETLGAALSLTTRADLVLAHAIEKGFDGPRRVAIGFCAGVKHATFMSARFTERGHAAEAVSAATSLDERRKHYANLQDPAHPLEWLFVADVLNEGVDLPAVNTVVFLRPTESGVVFLQQLGRGLRKHASTRVLTVIDLVGHHRSAFEPLRALHDPHALPTQRSRELSAALRESITPPEGCEVILDDKTLEVLAKVRAMTTPRRKRVEEVYRSLRAARGEPPSPLAFIGESELTLKDVRDTHGGWRQLRDAMGDAAAWERALTAGDPIESLLQMAERDHQRQVVTDYAAFWAALEVGSDPLAAYERFFEAHPEWSAEREDLTLDGWRAAVQQLVKKASLPAAVWTAATWSPTCATALVRAEVREAVRARLDVTLAKDHHHRHEGVLGTPADARRFAAYTRREIVNLWGEQYAPTRHGRGVIASGEHPGHHLLLASLDTKGAKKEHQYPNAVVDRTHVRWSSQNRMSDANAGGAIITRTKEVGARLHLFLARRAHCPFRYLGEVEVESHTGSAPMTVLLRLAEPIPDALWDEIHDDTTA